MTDAKYTIELEFSEVEILKVWLKEMHFNERSAHNLDVFLSEKIQDAETEANLVRARELNEEARLLLKEVLK